MDGFDRLLEQPAWSVRTLLDSADWLAAELGKVTQNPRTCRTNHLSLSGISYSCGEVILVSRKRNRSTAQSGNPPRTDEQGDVLRFINVRLPDEAYPEVDALRADVSNLCLNFVGLTTLPADVLVKRKRGTADWLAMLTLDDPYREGQFCAITAWGGDPVGAIAALLYKFESILQGQVPPPDVSRAPGARRYG
jgi:hypothetical protein